MNNISDFLASYESAENRAGLKFPIFVTKSMMPSTFIRHNFKTQIKSPDELWKFMDTQHEGRFKENLTLLNNGLTDNEYELFKKSVGIMVNFSKTLGKPLIPINSLSRAFIAYRGIKTFYEARKKQPSVLELGPGSGYLGLLCGISGWEYSCVEITQSLATYQNALFDFAGFKVKFAEEEKAYTASDFLQIPWWIWCDRKNLLPNREVVVANHVINEMSPLSLAYTIAKARTLNAKFIFAEGLGDPILFKQNMDIIRRNTMPIHVVDYSPRRENMASVKSWQNVNIWQFIDNSNVTTTNIKSNKSKPSIILVKAKRFLISYLNRFRPAAKLIKHAAKVKHLMTSSSGQNLNSDMKQPVLTVHADQLLSFIKTQKTPYISEDEDFMIFCNHFKHV